MGKRKRFTPPLDKITEDGILCSIISSLPLRDAVRSCALSRRWRHIWTQIPNLNFDPDNIFDAHTRSLVDMYDPSLEETEIDEILIENTHHFIASVNSVLQQRQGSARLDEFRVKYYLHGVHSHHIDAWVRFVAASNCKRLTLDLQPNRDPYTDLRLEPYRFPCQLLEASSVENLYLAFCGLKQPHLFHGFRRVKILKLNQVDVTEQDLDCLLSNCCALESLHVEDCRQLVALRTTHPLRQLKYLCVDGCYELTRIELNAVNLASLNYWGRPVVFVFRESSQLTAAHLSLYAPGDFDLAKLSKTFPRLEYLSLYMHGSLEVVMYLANAHNIFTFLKHLDWRVSYSLENEKGHLCLASLLSAAPFMEKLTMHYVNSHYLRELKQTKWRSPSRHTHLKTIEILQFSGDNWQIMYAVFLLNNAIELESMTLRRKAKILGDDDKKVLETNMEYLRREVPANTKLVIL